MVRRFIHYLLRISWHLRSVFAALIALIVLGAVLLAGVEKLPLGTAVYFAFVTGLTIGYGDIVANTAIGRIVCVLLGIIGILFTGLVVAVANHAVRQAWAETRNGE